ncbi:MAG TPA: serine hydrolase domain-containing protein [Ktedonobacteraceae bacterium]|jgi:CubicO group peptidase (beta-lactamase class C family)
MKNVENMEALEQVVSEELRLLNIPGATIAVVYEEELAFAKGFGIASSETGAPLTPDMLLRIGSVTKVITAYTLISLVQEQQLDVHTPIATYVPDLPAQVGRLTIHQLLCHTAGLKDDFSHYGPHDDAALGQAILRYGDQHFFVEPGQIFSYSALGYAVAGVVIEALSKQSYAQAIQERVLSPLKMERSTFYPTMAMTYPLSQGHEIAGLRQWRVVRPYDDTAERWPSGFLFSNVIELSRFTRAFMDDGRLDGVQVLLPEVIAVLTQPHVKLLESSNNDYYGYGVFLSENYGVRHIALGGSRRGFSSHLQMIPEHRFAVLQLLNRAGTIQMKRTSEKALELFLSLETQPTPSLPAELPITTAEIQRLAGRYRRPYIHTTKSNFLQLVDTEKKLMLGFGDRRPLFPVKKIDEGQFAVHFGLHIPPFTFAFQKGVNEEEDYICCTHRAHKRII